jgi:hypothetical protein
MENLLKMVYQSKKLLDLFYTVKSFSLDINFNVSLE